MSDALKESCDVYLYDLVAGEQGLGHEETIAVARRFGLGEQLCMDLIGETPGTVRMKHISCKSTVTVGERAIR